MFPDRIRALKAYKTETSEAKIRLSSNELPYDFPKHLKENAFKKAFEGPLNLYPDPNARELKEAVSDFFQIPEENLLLGNGSDEIIYYISIAVGDPKEGILFPEPTFPMYRISAQVVGREAVGVPLKENFELDLERMLKEAKRCALAYFAYPNNPTANLFSKEAIRKIREKVKAVVIDEAYFHYSGETFQEDALSREDTLVLRTLSKIGLASLRVGILIAKTEIVRELEKVRLPFNLSTPSQKIASFLLREGKEFIEEAVKKVCAERDRLRAEMESIKGVEVFPSKANFLLFRTPVEAGVLHQELLKEGVLVRDVSYMEGLERCLRVSVGQPEENDAFLEALEKSLSRLL